VGALGGVGIVPQVAVVDLGDNIAALLENVEALKGGNKPALEYQLSVIG